uniref:Uncharacterized protein n=1 Tax=Pyramimonas obovata TaxID=1411642 RepID=A0A7S0RNN2_9CHLO
MPPEYKAPRPARLAEHYKPFELTTRAGSVGGSASSGSRPGSCRPASRTSRPGSARSMCSGGSSRPTSALPERPRTPGEPVNWAERAKPPLVYPARTPRY